MLTAAELTRQVLEVWPAADVTCDELTATTAVASMTPDDDAIRPGGYICGPAQFTIADTALWFLVSGVQGRFEPMALTSELSIRYLRPALGEQLHARAVLDRAGRTSVVATVRVWTDDEARPCAVAQGTYTLPVPREP